jgi:hypothetical protein
MSYPPAAHRISNFKLFFVEIISLHRKIDYLVKIPKKLIK